jgi:hypothetical protein
MKQSCRPLLQHQRWQTLAAAVTSAITATSAAASRTTDLLPISATLLNKDLLGFLMVYCSQQDERWFMSYERLKLGNFHIFICTGIY